MPLDRVKIRYVVWSDSNGALLGVHNTEPVWSMIDPMGRETAPTFASQVEVTEYLNRVSRPEALPTYRLVECHPDKGDLASPEALVNAGLARWEVRKKDPSKSLDMRK